MADEILKEEEKKVERKEDEEEVEKAYDVIADTLKAVVESQKTILESHKSLADNVNSLTDSVSELQKAQDGAYKSPSGSDASMDAKPKVSDADDIGAKIDSVPSVPYEQGEQAKLDDDRTVADKPEKDDTKVLARKSEPEMVQKSEHTFTTETPRPNASIENVDKNYQQDFSQILKDARSVGHDGLSEIALKIQSGHYYKPSDDEVGLI
tara:strand:+ start:1771 stop:2397 length:627 start_codon:yes stop_codon:yes gene_type:complete